MSEKYIKDFLLLKMSCRNIAVSSCDDPNLISPDGNSLDRLLSQIAEHIQLFSSWMP
jgi:hypothetical protein